MEAERSQTQIPANEKNDEGVSVNILNEHHIFASHMLEYIEIGHMDCICWGCEW